MENRHYGYIRVSSKDQNEERQTAALREKGIHERDIFTKTGLFPSLMLTNTMSAFSMGISRISLGMCQ